MTQTEQYNAGRTGSGTDEGRRRHTDLRSAGRGGPSPFGSLFVGAGFGIIISAFDLWQGSPNGVRLRPVTHRRQTQRNEIERGADGERPPHLAHLVG